MSDEPLRELERRWRETGAREDQAALPLERTRRGDLRRADLSLAGYLGSEAALACGSSPASPELALADWLAVIRAASCSA